MAKRLEGISFKPETQWFKTLNVNPDNVVDRINARNRNVDTDLYP